MSIDSKIVRMKILLSVNDLSPLKLKDQIIMIFFSKAK